MNDHPLEDQERFTIRLETSEIQVAPGGSYTLRVVLLNHSSEEDAWRLSMEGIPLEWVSVPVTPVRVPAGGQGEAQLTIQVPEPDSAQSRMGRYPFAVRAISQKNPTQTAKADGTLSVAAYAATRGRVSLMMDSLQFVANPGSATTLMLQVTNQGLSPDQFRLAVDGIPVSWVSTPTPAFQLNPGESKEIYLTVRPPRSPQSRAGRNPFRIHVISQTSPDQTATADCTLTLASFTQFSSALQPQRVHAGRTGRVMLENQGNAQQVFDLFWESQDDLLQFEPSQTQSVRVPAGELSGVEFHAAPYKRPILGGEAIYPFTVRVQTTGKDAQLLRGEVSSQAMIPFWVIPVVVLLCLSVVCVSAILLWRTPSTSPDATQTALSGAAQTLSVQQTLSALVTLTLGAQTPVIVLPSNTPIPTFTSLPTSTLLPPTNTLIPTLALPTSTASSVPTVIPPTSTPSLTPTATPTPSNTPLPDLGPGLIAISSNREGNFEIYTIDTRSKRDFRLTFDAGWDTEPAWSPDGNRIAFASNRTGNFEIYIMNADGTGIYNLSNNPADDRHPSWSPDGQFIAFSTNRDGNQEIYVARFDGTMVSNLSFNSAEDYQPSWYVDGGQSWLAFTSNRDGNQEVYIMKADGSSQSNLTENPANDYMPSAAPDGSRIAFVSNRDGNQEIYTMRSNGSRQTNLSRHPAEDFYPDWAPSFLWIAFVTNRTGSVEIFVMDPEGFGPFNFTNNPAEDNTPAWR